MLLPVGISDHISEATYYRLFIEQHLPNDIDEILYIDPDVVCLNNNHIYEHPYEYMAYKIANEYNKTLVNKYKIL